MPQITDRSDDHRDGAGRSRAHGDRDLAGHPHADTGLGVAPLRAHHRLVRRDYRGNDARPTGSPRPTPTRCSARACGSRTPTASTSSAPLRRPWWRRRPRPRPRRHPPPHPREHPDADPDGFPGPYGNAASDSVGHAHRDADEHRHADGPATDDHRHRVRVTRPCRDRGARGDAAPPPSMLRPFPVVRIKGVLTAQGARVTLLSVRAPRRSSVTVTCRREGLSRPPVHVAGVERAAASLRARS